LLKDKREIIIRIEQINALCDLLAQKRQQKRNITPDELERILKEIEDRIKTLSIEAENIEKAKISELARRRTLVLAITTIIELTVAWIISHFEKTIATYAAIYAFAPLVSAVAGNYGLQTATIIIRALAVGTMKDRIKAVLREVTVGAWCGISIGILAGTIAWLRTGRWEALPVITLALWAGMMTSGFMGSVFPQISKYFGFDPAILAGPAETAFQDLASYTTFLAILTLLVKLGYG